MNFDNDVPSSAILDLTRDFKRDLVEGVSAFCRLLSSMVKCSNGNELCVL